MQAFSRDRAGLTEGVTNRYLRTNRSVLIPSFEGIYRGDSQISTDKSRLQSRLEELLVFEILKDG
jgi:hypothetical protein